jgi:serine/threonine protein phosphatase PrpC
MKFRQTDQAWCVKNKDVVSFDAATVCACFNDGMGGYNAGEVARQAGGSPPSARR